MNVLADRHLRIHQLLGRSLPQPLLRHEFVQQEVGEDHLLARNVRQALGAPFRRLDAAHDALVAERVATLGDVRLGDQLEADRTQKVRVLHVHRRSDSAQRRRLASRAVPAGRRGRAAATLAGG